MMEAAYMLASDNGQLPAKARQIMYAARPRVLALRDPWPSGSMTANSPRGTCPISSQSIRP